MYLWIAREMWKTVLVQLVRGLVTNRTGGRMIASMAHGVTGSAHAGKILRDGEIRVERITRKGIRVYVKCTVLAIILSWRSCR